MAKQVQFRRGTTSQHSTFTGAAGEITVDTDKNTAVVHDGSTAGGHPLATSLADLGVTASAADLNTTDVTTLGTVEASKVVTADANGDVTFPDGEKAIFGAGSDLQIYHDGTHSRIDNNTGDLFIQSDTVIRVTNSAASETAAKFFVDGAVELYHDNDRKLGTQSAGVNVFGILTRDTGINVNNSSGFAAFELGGLSGAYLDMKAPFSEDVDGRVQYDAGGNGALIITTNGGNSSPVVIKQQDVEKLRTSTLGVEVTGEFIADSYNETYAAVTSSSNATTVNCEAGNAFSHTLTENTTFTFSNPPASGTAYSFSIEIIQDASASGFTVTWPASVDWPSGTAPTLTATASAKDVFVFTTRDGGTNWYGFTAGLALA